MDQEREEIYRRFKEAMGHGHLNMGTYCEDVDVKLWIPEFNAFPRIFMTKGWNILRRISRVWLKSLKKSMEIK